VRGCGEERGVRPAPFPSHPLQLPSREGGGGRGRVGVHTVI
jgi:hypothetical protein